MKEQNILVYPPQGKGAPFRFVYTPDKPTTLEAITSAIRTSFARQEKAHPDFPGWLVVIDSAVAELGGSWKPMEYFATVWL